MRRAGPLAAVALSAGIAACFTKPDAPVIGGGNGGDGGLDGRRPQDGAIDATPCTGPSDDMSPMPMVCGSWGNQDTSGGSASLTRTGGGLQATLSGSGSHAYCYTTQNFDFVYGTSIEVVSPLQAGPGDTTDFTATFPTGGFLTLHVQLVMMQGLQFQGACSGPGGFSNSAAFGPQARFWKLGPASGGAFGAFVSPDGMTWTSIGSCSLMGQDTSQASVRFGATGGSATSTRSATIDTFTTCTTR